MRGVRAAEVVALLVLVAGLWIGFATGGLPAVRHTASTSPDFSADRALDDLKVISADPHAVGTDGHDHVRDFVVRRLRELGCSDISVQVTTGFNTLEGPIAASVSNVMCRLPGTVGGPTIVMMAHYDAVPRSHGAGDDGAGVVAILEAVRALRSGTPLARDVIVLLSDAEESGLLGAEAFVDLHPWANDVGAVINFDGRGDRGPVYMFQTSAGNAPMIAALDAGVPDARANSLTGEVYRHLPSDTDLSIWLHSTHAVGALNFADVGGFTHYHTPIDDIASLDPRVVQQMGDYAVGVTRRLGLTSLTGLQTRDAIYFNAPLLGVFRYPASWALPLAIGSAVALGLLVLLFRSQFSATGVTRGSALIFPAVAVPALLVFGAWRLVQLVHPEYADILQRDPYNSRWYLLGAAGLTVALVTELQVRFRARATALELALAPLALWAIVGIVAAIVLPGASYLLAIPLLGGLVGFGAVALDPEGQQANRAMVALTALPLLVLWPPLIVALETSLTAQMLGFCTVMIGLMLTMLVIQLDLTGSLRRGIVGVAVAVAVTGFAGAEFSAGFDATHKHPDSLFFLQDVDSTRAWWVSFDRTTDAWTGPVLGENPARRTFDTYRLTPSGGGLLAHDAPPLDAPASPVHLLLNSSDNGVRHVHLHVDRSGPGEEFALMVDNGTVTAMTLDDRPLEARTTDRYGPQYRMGTDGTALRFFGVPAAGVDIWMTIQEAGHPSLRLITSTDGLPPRDSALVAPRPPEFMSKPFIPTDVTMFARTIPL